MTNPEPGSDLVGYRAILDYENDATCDVAGHLREPLELFVHLAADGTLRAMLENENGICLRSLEQLFEILFLTQFNHHLCSSA